MYKLYSIPTYAISAGEYNDRMEEIFILQLNHKHTSN